MFSSSIRLSLRLGIGAQFLLLLIVSVVGLFSLNQIAERTDKADDANRIVKYIFDLRTEEKNYILRNSDHYIDNVSLILNKIRLQIVSTTHKFNNSENVNLIKKLGTTTDNYIIFFDQFLTVNQEINDINIDINHHGHATEELLSEFSALQQKQANSLLIKEYLNDDLAEEFFEANSANIFLNNLLSIRNDEKNFQLWGDMDVAAHVQQRIASLINGVKKMQDSAERLISREVADRVFGELVLYEASFRQLGAKVKEKTDIQSSLVDCARLLEKFALDLREDQKYELSNDTKKAAFVLIFTAVIVLCISFITGLTIEKKLIKGVDLLLALINRLDKKHYIRDYVGPIPDNELGVVANKLVAMDSHLRDVSLTLTQQTNLFDHLGALRFVFTDQHKVLQPSAELMDVIGCGDGKAVDAVISNQFDFKLFDSLIRCGVLNRIHWSIKDCNDCQHDILLTGIRLDESNIFIIGVSLKTTEECSHPLAHCDPMAACLILLDEKNNIEYANKPARCLLDVLDRSLIGMTGKELTQKQYCDIILDNATLKAISKKTDKDSPSEIIINPNRLEKKRYASLKVFEIPENNSKILFALLLTDISHIRLSEERIHRLAYYDSLTGLPNRAQFKDELNRRISMAQRHERMFALLFVDIDNFKQINDSLGHHTGDEILKLIGSHLSSSLRENEFLGRLGGDEFCVLTDWLATKHDPVMLAQRFLDLQAHPFFLPDFKHPLSITMSIGIAVYPINATTSMALMQSADTAMYKAKNDGKNCFEFYNDSLTTIAKDELKQLQLMRQAIKRKEFELYWQPIVDSATKRVVKVEALLRWRHPDSSIIAPGHFIPILERHGLMIKVSEWVLNEACRQVAEWRADGLDIVASINVDASYFQFSGFSDHVGDTLDAHNLPPHCIDLEITENVAHDTQDALKTCQVLDSMGVSVAIDDFGTGYSSLSVLKRLGANSLKIDKAFVDEVLNDARDQEVIVAIYNIGKALGMQVVAEGVETNEQATFLSAIGIHLLQGYYFSKPLPADKISSYLQGL